MSKHTPEPWEVRGECGIWSEDGFVATTNPHVRPFATIQATNAARIVACVNACEGINPQAIPDLLKAAKGLAECYTLTSQQQVQAHDRAIAAIKKAEALNHVYSLRLTHRRIQ